MSDTADMIREALQQHEKRTLDAAVRCIGKLVEEYTVIGSSREATGASAAMELIKLLRDGPDAAAR